MLSREQWALACAIDGALSVQDLAWHCGLALYDTIECVGYLIQAGVCAPSGVADPVPAAEAAGPLSRWFGVVADRASKPEEPPVLSPTAVLTPVPPAADLPRRTPRVRNVLSAAPVHQVMSAEVWATDTEPPGGGDYLPAQPELLRRVLDSLRKLA